MRRTIIWALLLAIPGPVFAQQMNAEVFLQRALKLKAKGPLALLSRSEIKALMGEVQAANNALSATYKADKDAGRAPRFCPPKGKQAMDSDEVLKRLAAIPVSDRKRITMTEAMTRVMIQKYPCRSAG